MDVAQSTQLRARSREAGVEFVVAKNTLTRRAADEAGVEDLSEYLVGPTALPFSEDPVASAKLMAEFADQAGVVALSRLPSREQLLAQVVGGISSPLTGLVNVLNNTVQGLVFALNQIAEQKGAQS